jgi:predicted phosphate transport protein (TIGR00153 family)
VNFSFLPAEVKFYDYLAKATANLLAGARALQRLLDHCPDIPAQVTEIARIEHEGDLIVHEVTNLLPRTLITPIDGEDIQRLISAIDDALDGVDAAAQCLVTYQINEIKQPARELARLITESVQELEIAIRKLPSKRLYAQVRTHIVQINTLENEGDRALQQALSDLVAHRDDMFDFIRWKEIYELLEKTTDYIEDAGDVIQKVMIANA